MFHTSSLLSYLLLSASLTGALASPVVEEGAKPVTATLPFKVRYLAGDGSVTNIVKRDDARRAAREARADKEKRQVAPSSIPATNTLDGFTVEVGIGSPATTYTLLVDSRSGNTWIGAGATYRQTSTSHNTGKHVSVTYTWGGEFAGLEWTDEVTLSHGLLITAQSIGVASSSSGFDGLDGVLGLGNVASTAGTVSGVAEVLTVADNLLSQGKISTEVIGISFLPAANGPQLPLGELTFGGIDETRFGGTLSYTPMVTLPGYTTDWAVTVSVDYGTTALFSNYPAIIDAGSTLISLPHQAYETYVSATGATLDSATNLLKLPANVNPASIETLNFNIGGNVYSIFGAQQIWPSYLNTEIGGEVDGVYLIVADGGRNPAISYGTVLGIPFLQHHYVVLDTTLSRVGIAGNA